MGDLARLLQNREHGATVERWVADVLLERVHVERRVVGGLHGGAVPESNAYDVDADGLCYEVKACMERVGRQNVPSGSQPGRWKIDTVNHHGLDPERAARCMYVLVVCDERGPKRAYLVSHAKMSGILARYAKQGRFVSLTTSVWESKLLRVWSRPPGVACPTCSGRISRHAIECRHCKHVLDEDALHLARRHASDMKEAERVALRGMPL